MLPPTPFAPGRSHQPCGGFGGHHPHQLTEIIKPIGNPSSGSVQRHLQKLIKHGYVEHVGNAYCVTDKVNIPELQSKLQRRIDMVTETAKRLAEVGASR